MIVIRLGFCKLLILLNCGIFQVLILPFAIFLLFLIVIHNLNYVTLVVWKLEVEFSFPPGIQLIYIVVVLEKEQD